MCLCDVCMPPLPEDTLWLIPEREQWERELWVWSDNLGMWVQAPKVKVWRAGEAGKELPILRTGSRTSIYGDGSRKFDVPYVGDSDYEIAKYALEHAGIAMPATVDLVRFVREPHGHYKISLTVDPADALRVDVVMASAWIPPPMEDN